MRVEQGDHPRSGTAMVKKSNLAHIHELHRLKANCLWFQGLLQDDVHTNVTVLELLPAQAPRVQQPSPLQGRWAVSNVTAGIRQPKFVDVFTISHIQDHTPPQSTEIS